VHGVGVDVAGVVLAHVTSHVVLADVVFARFRSSRRLPLCMCLAHLIVHLPNEVFMKS
jgi:hypothetical protein